MEEFMQRIRKKFEIGDHAFAPEKDWHRTEILGIFELRYKGLMPSGIKPQTFHFQLYEHVKEAADEQLEKITKILDTHGQKAGYSIESAPAFDPAWIKVIFAKLPPTHKR